MNRKNKDPLGSLNHSRARYVAIISLFLTLTIISGFVTFNAYVGNSKEAKRRYDALIAVDTKGGDVEKALFELRSYIYEHMNTTIGSQTGVKPPIQLSGTYARLVAAEKARAASAKAANASLYTTAQQVCEKQIPDGLSGRGRIPCITDYVTKHAQPETEQTIPDGLYKYDFVAPRWSPDEAGYGMLVTTSLFLVFSYRFIGYRRLKRLLKEQ